MGVLENTLRYIQHCVIEDKPFLIDPRLDDDRAKDCDCVDTVEVPLVAVTPPSGVVSEERTLTTLHVEFE